MNLFFKRPAQKKKILKKSISRTPLYNISIADKSRNRLSQRPFSEIPIFKLIQNSSQFRIVLISGLSALLVWGVLALAPQPVIIKVDGQPMVYRTLFRTVGSVLSAAGVKLGPNDTVQPDLGATVNRDMVISVNRAVEVRVNVDGRSMLVWTPKLPVQQVLQTAQVSLGPLDQVVPSLNQLVAAGTVIEVNRMTKQFLEKSYEIPAPVQRINDPQMEMGQSRLVRAGTPGEGQRLLMITYINGKPSQQLQVEDTVLSSPQSNIIAFGTVAIASRGGQAFHFRESIEVLATAYSARPGTLTCTGQLCRFGEVAVDPRVIPLGTRLYIDGYGYAVAEDMGTAIKGNRTDLFFDSNIDSDRWGLRRTKVYILSP
jgi:uncharacterized protein YabE (DUF348 family)